ncbi:MAG TPA: methylmalonyl Co-A mutase-associated GTPase MeaB [Candidatus Acidoferrales bacterium]|nr:methylmalonyl Co-A mutase-associated GTPase MeaB [Candidatus Acidoferrales bacterium]
MMLPAVDSWAEQVRAGDIRAIARAISAIENGVPEAELLIRELFPHTGRAAIVGVTGAPGTGKSTLVDRLAGRYRRAGHTVGIVAVDPTSPFTGGAILGDRIRMQGHATDGGIFIRSMATRGWLGGLAEATSEAALVLDAAGKQMVLIETVGVGQDEVEVVRLADCTLVVLVPGMGDDVQNLKAGLMEIGDVFVLNKADHAGADRFERQLRSVLEIVPPRDGWRPPVVRTVATEGAGIDDLAAAIDRFRAEMLAEGRRPARRIAHWKQRLLELLHRRLMLRVGRHLDERQLDGLAEAVAGRRMDPFTAVDEMLAKAGIE